MRPCIMCASALSADETSEHILLDALGGRVTTKKAICGACNHEFGGGPDLELASKLAPLRNIGNFRSGKRRNPPSIDVEAEGGKFKLNPGGILALKIDPPMRDQPDGSISITGRDEDHVRQLLRSAARKLKVPVEQQDEYVERAIRDARRSHQTPPNLSFGLELGSLGAQRSMVKACLVLWNEVVENFELSSDRYDSARLFAKGERSGSPVVQADTRPLPLAEMSYGSNPNIIWVGSDENGRVLGYYRIFGAIGWSFELCCSGAPKNLRRCLVSDPYDTKNRSDGEEVLPDISFGWVKAASKEDCSEVRRKFGGILARAHHNAFDREVDMIFSEVCKDLGFDDDDQPLSAAEAFALDTEFCKRFTTFIISYLKARSLSP